MRKTFAVILSAASAWLLLLAMLLTGVFFCTTSRAFYRHEYQKYDNAAVIGITDEGLMEITEGLLDYLAGKRDNLDMQKEIRGQMREVFTQREKDHMVDVRYLIKLARIALPISLLGGVAAWVGAWLLVRKVKGGRKLVGIGYLAGAALLFIATGIVVLLASRDFTAVFVKFHEIFFTNDLWLLNWDDMLIMMVPEPFFMDCAALIAIVFAIGLILTSVIALLLIMLPGREQKNEATTIAAVGSKEGDSFYKIENSKEEVELNVEQILARLGLDDEDDGDEEELLPPVPAQPAAVAEPVQPVAAEFPVKTPDGSELSVRFEMQLDLKVEKTDDGKLMLAVDPDRKPQVMLSSLPGRLVFTIYDEPAALPPAKNPTVLQESAQRLPIEGPVPSPEELLKQMDELMKGFPADDKGENE